MNTMKWHNKSLVLVTTAIALFVITMAATQRANGQDKTSPTPSPSLLPLVQQSDAPKPSDHNPWQREQPFTIENSVSGTVRYANGKPAKGFRVEARFVHYATGARGEGFAITDDRGHYTIRELTNQAFNIFLRNEGKPFLPRVLSQPVTLSPENRKVDNIDFILDAGPVIKVRVRDVDTGKPIAGLTVKANKTEWSSTQPIGVTDAKGEFVYHSPNRKTELEIEPTVDSSLQPAPGYHFLYGQTLKPGEKAVWNVRAGKDLYSRKVATLTGIVTQKGGKPYPGVKVRLLRGKPAEERGEETVTDEQGAFSFQTDPVTDKTDKSGTVLLLEKDGETMVRFVRAADSWSNLQLKWQPSETATVSGLVQDPDGHPLEGVPINYHAHFWNPKFRQSDINDDLCHTGENAGVTDKDGRFAIKGLHPEAYYAFEFGVAYQNGDPQIFGFTDYPDPPQQGVFLFLKAQENRDIGTVIVLRANGVITGMLVDAAGKPVTEDVAVEIHGKHTRQSANLKLDGSFHVTGISDEPLYLQVFYVRDKSYQGGENSPDQAVRVPVRAGDKNVRVVVPPRRP